MIVMIVIHTRNLISYREQITHVSGRLVKCSTAVRQNAFRSLQYNFKVTQGRRKLLFYHFLYKRSVETMSLTCTVSSVLTLFKL